MKIAVILSSTRSGYSFGWRVSQWIMNETKKFQQAEFNLLDLRDYDLPIFNEEIGSRGNKNKKLYLR